MDNVTVINARVAFPMQQLQERPTCKRKCTQMERLAVSATAMKMNLHEEEEGGKQS